MKTAIKTLIIVALLCVVADGLYRFLFWPHDRVAYSGPLVALVDKIDSTGADILYLGESSNHTFGWYDSDTAWISQMVARHFPSLRVADMTHDASHGEVYYQLLRNLDTECNISTVVVTMNLRSFGVGWIYSPLETALQKRLVMLQQRPPLVNRAVLSFKAYDIKSEGERYAQMDRYWADHPLPGHPSVPLWADSLAGDNNMAGIFIRNFAFLIDTLNNPRVHDFDRIVHLSRQRGWNLVFNLLPEDIQLADSLVGTDLTALMKSNATILEQRYTRLGVVVVNNLETVPDSLFRDRDWTTEHFLLQGRQTVADNVSKALSSFFPDQYCP